MAARTAIFLALVFASSLTVRAAGAPLGYSYLWLSGSLGPVRTATKGRLPLWMGGNLQVNAAKASGSTAALAFTGIIDGLFPSNSQLQFDFLAGRRWCGRVGYLALAGGLGLVKNEQVYDSAYAGKRNPLPGVFRHSRTLEHCRDGGSFGGMYEEDCRRYEAISSWTLAIPLEAQVMPALPFAGLGISLKGNLNPANPVISVMMTFALGNIKERWAVNGTGDKR